MLSVALCKAFQTMCSDFEFLLGQKQLIFEWVILSKLSFFEHFELNTLFHLVFYGLSEYQKIIGIGQIKRVL